MKQRVALVTGAGRGIGRAAALALAETGVQVALSARSMDEIDAVATQVEERGGKALRICDDLAERQAPTRILAQLSKHWGPVDILVNNAGVGSSQNPKPLVDFDDDFWDLSFAVNVTAPYLLTKAVLPGMLAQGWGRIVNVASVNAQIPALHAAAYVASKHALAGLTKATAKEVAEQGVTVNAVCPGVTATLMNDKRVAYDARRLGTAAADIEAQATPLGRRLLPAEVAAVIAFLASDSASAVNGQLLNVSAGAVIA